MDLLGLLARHGAICVRRGGRPLWEEDHGRVKGRCRECGKKAEPPRVSWCSQSCVDTYLLRTDPGAQRAAVFARDRGVCSHCRRDCVELRGQLQPLLSFNAAATSLVGLVGQMGGKLPGWWREQYGHERADKIDRAVALVTELDLIKQVLCRESFWDMDHVRPLWAGGSNDLTNLRTLCIPCHRDATREGAALRASQRKK